MSEAPRPDLDPRMDPRLRAFLAPMVAHGNQTPSDDLSIPELQAAFLFREKLAHEYVLKPGFGEVPTSGLKSYVVEISVPGRPDNMRLYINRPGDDKQYPAFVYTHGGGMSMFSAEMYEPASRRFAHEGLVVITPDFRNATIPGCAFPAGLNDCYAALEWVTENTEELGSTSQVIVGGESGGGNLSIATAILAKDRGLQGLKGLYAHAPYIAGHCDSKSWDELNGYWLWKSVAGYKMYLGDGVDESQRHIALPGHATAHHLKGLVPTVVLVDELDPLKDEGLAFYRTALAAGVRARLLMSGGMVHAADIFGGLVPDVAKAHAENVANFARSL